MQPINLVRGSDYALNIVFPDTGNELFAVQSSELRCTCEEFLQNGSCKHVRYGNPKYDTWKRAQLRRLEHGLVGNTPTDVLANSLAEEYDLDFFSDKVIVQPQSANKVYIQKETTAAKRYSFGCGYGTGGRDVTTITTYPATGVLTLLAQSATDVVNAWNFEVDKRILLGTHPLPALSPRIHVPSGELSESILQTNSPFAGIGRGLIDLSLDEDEDEHPPSTCSKIHWLMKSIGLDLVDEGYAGDYRYFPGMTKNDQPIGGLAFDLDQMALKTLPSSEIERYSENVPPAFRNCVAHVHLPWGQQYESSLFAQVIVRHPNRSALKRDENLELLTTNYWTQFGDVINGENFHWLPEELLVLAQYVAEVMIRMGHNPDALLYYGECSCSLSDLADEAKITTAPAQAVNALEKLAALYMSGKEIPTNLVSAVLNCDLERLLPE